jgi:TP901 family phage tail tape measure protein
VADVNANIHINADVVQAKNAIRGLTQQLNAFNAAANLSNRRQLSGIKNIALDIQNAAANTRSFTAEFEKVRTSASILDKTLSRGKGTLGQYFDAKFIKNGTSANRVLDLANERARILGSSILTAGQSVKGFQESLRISGINNFNDQLTVAAQKQQLLSNMFRQGTTQLINFGKNTQWAGRQLMVGFTVPLTILGSTAGKVFMELEQQLVYFKRVYGDVFTTTAETQKNLDSVMELAKGFTKYGIAVKDTLALAGQVAASGRQDVELRDAVIQATRLATLGQMEQNTALKATIALQSAFRISGNELAGTIDFLNAVENQTVVSLEDISQAIPRVAPVIRGLGGDVKDLTVFLAAMQEGGVSAEQGANALKSGLASLVNPTKAATETLSGFNINLDEIITKNKGDLMGTVMAFGKALQGLDMFSRQQALEKVFGKYQYARLGALFENIGREGSQAAQVMDLMGYSTAELANLSARELSRIEEAYGTKLKAAIEEFKLSIAPIGEMFVRIATPVIKFATTIANAFNSLPEGIKKIIGFGTILVGLIIPTFLMFSGLLFNLIGQLLKFGQNFALIAKGMATGGMPQALRLIGQSANYASIEELKSAEAAKQLSLSTAAANQALDYQATKSLPSVIKQLDLLNTKLGEALTKQDALARAVGGGLLSPAKAAQKGVKNITPKKFATGGKVPGSGSGDTVPALLTPGEFVINKEASQRYAPFLTHINRGAVGQFAEGLNAVRTSYTQGDMNPGFRITQDASGKVQFRNARGQFASENIAVKANILAAKAATAYAEQTKQTTNRMAALSGKVSMATGAVGSVAMMSAIMSGGQNEFANKLMMASMAISLASTMIVGPYSAIAVAAVAVVGGLYMVHKSNEAQVKKGVELGNAMSFTAKTIKEMGSYFGTKSNYEKMMQNIGATTAPMNKMLTEGKNFLESEQGKIFVKEVQQIRKDAGGNAAQTRDLVANKLAQAVASGIMTQDQAQSIAYALGENLKDMKLGIAIYGRMTSIVGPNGEDLEKDPLSVALQLNSNAEKQVELAQKRVDELSTSLGKISELWSGRADEAKRAIGELTVFNLASIEAQKQNIATVSLQYDKLIKKAKDAKDLSEEARLTDAKNNSVSLLQEKLEQRRLQFFQEFQNPESGNRQKTQDEKTLQNIKEEIERQKRIIEKTENSAGAEDKARYKNSIKELKRYEEQLKVVQDRLQNSTGYLESFTKVGKVSFAALGAQITSLYGDNPYVKAFLTASEKETVANANLRISVVTGAIDPGIAGIMSEEMQSSETGKRTYNRLFNLDFAVLGEKTALELATNWLNMDEVQQKTFQTIYETRGAAEMARLAPLLSQVQNVPQLIDVVLSINTVGMTDEQLINYRDGLIVIDQFPSVIGKEVVIEGIDKKDILEIDALNDKLNALGSDKERYDFIINSQIFGGENLALFQQMWTTLSKDPQKVIQFMAVFSTGSSEIEDNIKQINKLREGGITYYESQDIKGLQDRNDDITKSMLDSGKVIQDTNAATTESEGERTVSSLEYLRALLELKMKGLDPAAAAQLDQLEAVQLNEQAIGRQIKSIEKLNEEQRIAAMTTEALKDETQRLGDSLTISSSLIDSQVKVLERNSIKPIQDKIDSYQKSLEKISKKEEQVNKIYDQRLKALKAVEQQNQRNAEQQKNQIDLASALTSGDIASAAIAASNITSTAAGYALQDTESALEESKQQEISNITEEINGKLMNRIQIEKEIEAQQLKLVDIEKEKAALLDKQFKIQTLTQLMAVTGQLRNTANKTQRDLLLTQAQAMGTTLGVSDIQASGAFSGLSKELGIDLSAVSVEITSAVQTSQKSVQELAGHTKSVADSFKLSASLFKKAETEASNSLSFMTGISSLWGDRNTGLVAAGADIYASVVSARDAIKLGISDINNAKNKAIDAITAASKPKKEMYGGVIGYMSGGMVNYKGSREPAPGMMMGGKMKKYAVGSQVPGIGITDKVPALLTPGEFVVRKSVTKANLPLLEALNGNIFPNMNSGVDSNVTPIISTSNVSNVNAPVYNYNVNVNVAETNASANEIAGVVMNKIRMTQDKTIRGNRY